MISHLYCIRNYTTYIKWSNISKPYLLCSKQKGVQALLMEIREMDGSTFFVMVKPLRAEEKGFIFIILCSQYRKDCYLCKKKVIANKSRII